LKTRIERSNFAGVSVIMTGWKIRSANENDLNALRTLHVTNHLEETAHSPDELEHQKKDLEDDFPFFYNKEHFVRGEHFVAIDNENGKIIGSIRLDPDESSHIIVWLCAFSVIPGYRGRGIGRGLLNHAIRDAMRKEHLSEIHLITLDKHSDGHNVMGVARKMYEAEEFVRYKEKEVIYGMDKAITVCWYKKYLKS